MRTRALSGLVAAALIVLLSVAPPAPAQGLDRPAQLAVDRVIVSGLGADGKAHAGQLVTVRADFTVVIPGAAVCVGEVFRVNYSIMSRPEGTTATLAPTSEARPFQGGASGQPHEQFVSVTGYEWEGWDTTVTLAIGDDTPSGTQTIQVRAKLWAGAGVASGCNVTGTGSTAVAEALIVVA